MGTQDTPTPRAARLNDMMTSTPISQ
jgi:hypothetical protein